MHVYVDINNDKEHISQTDEVYHTNSNSSEFSDTGSLKSNDTRVSFKRKNNFLKQNPNSKKNLGQEKEQFIEEI